MSTSTWCDHWKQCVWFLPGEGVTIGKGQKALLHATHNETKIFYNLAVQDFEARHNKFTPNNFHLTLPPERIAIYGDSNWRSSMLRSLRNAFQGRVQDQPLCVVADDSVFLTVAAARVSKTARIIPLFPGLREEGAHYLKATADANGFTADRVNVFLDKRRLTLQDTNQKKVDLLIGEPYFYGNDGMLPWQNLRFWKIRTMLDDLLSDDVIIMPCKAILKACAMSLPDLWNSRRSLGKIEGFDHSAVDTTLGACGELPSPHESPFVANFIWQCGEIKELSEQFTIMEFDLSKSMTSHFGKVQVELSEGGICHGFALWIDWVVDGKNDESIDTGNKG